MWHFRREMDIPSKWYGRRCWKRFVPVPKMGDRSVEDLISLDQMSLVGADRADGASYSNLKNKSFSQGLPACLEYICIYIYLYQKKENQSILIYTCAFIYKYIKYVRYSSKYIYIYILINTCYLIYMFYLSNNFYFAPDLQWVNPVDKPMVLWLFWWFTRQTHLEQHPLPQVTTNILFEWWKRTEFPFYSGGMSGWAFFASFFHI